MTAKKTSITVGTLLLAGLAFGMTTDIASAGRCGGGYYYGGPAYYAPPVYYAPPAYYAPPVYYYPGPTYYVPQYSYGSYGGYYAPYRHRSFSFGFGYYR